MTKSTMLQNPAVSQEQLKKDITETVRRAQEDARAAAEEARSAAQEAAREGQPVLVPRPPLPPMPGVSVHRFPEETIPPQVESISIAFFITIAAIIIGYPLMRAFAKRIERGTPAPAVPQEVRDQLSQLTQSVEAIAIEVERISEGQRYTTKLLSEQPRESSRAGGGQS